MYDMTDVAKQINRERRAQAQVRRNVQRVRALHRTERTVLRAERLMCEAHNEALRLRWELEAES